MERNATGLVRAIIADDERIARLRVRDLLSSHSWIRCIAETTDAKSTIARANSDKPDIVFLDIAMPGMLGTEVLQLLTFQPVVIFTTAYDRYAVDAFNLDAADYLLKPITEARFAEAMDRIRRALSVKRPLAVPDASMPQQRIFVRRYAQIVPVPVAEIIHIEARRDYVILHTPRGRQVARLTMQYLERSLDTNVFTRIHRAHIVNMTFVEVMRPADKNRLLVRLRNGTEITASRSHSKRLREFSA